MKKPKDHPRVTPNGRAMGKNAARMAELGLVRLKADGLDNLGLPTLRDDMCNSCACRSGSVPNSCLQTQLDLLKTAVQGLPFFCHAPNDGRMCAGWVRMRAHIVANPMPQAVVDVMAKHEFSPPDEVAL